MTGKYYGLQQTLVAAQYDCKLLNVILPKGQKMTFDIASKKDPYDNSKNERNV